MIRPIENTLLTCRQRGIINESIDFTGNNARSLFDRLEFGPDECGSFEMNGTVDVNPIPLFSTNLHVELEKQKVCPTI